MYLNVQGKEWWRTTGRWDDGTTDDGTTDDGTT
jgi:hypothetical protein